MKWTTLGGVTAACVAMIGAGQFVAAPAAHAIFNDTHIVAQGSDQTFECNDATLFVHGAYNHLTVKGTCWGVTVQGSGNTIVVDTVINDITVFGIDQTVFFHNGDPMLVDRGRELGMANRLQRVPA